MRLFICIVSYLFVAPLLIKCEKTYSVDSLDVHYPPTATEPKLPKFSNLLERIQHFNPDTVESSSRSFKETIQHFNFSDAGERNMALKFRQAEIPFKVYDIPNIDEVVVKWTDDYLLKALADDKNVNTLVSNNNHFMYWTGKKQDSNKYSNPVDRSDMPFATWLQLARDADDQKLANDAKHYYFRKNEKPGSKNRRSTFVGRDLKDFSSSEDNFFVSDVSKNKGIQCRFGMRGIIAESHYDSGRNMVAMLKGTKRYILTPPESCKYLGIISDPKHPSYRHSVIDWSDTHQAKAAHFDRVQAVDTLVKAGEVLYIPSFWFHYIVSMDTSIQCNTRSGRPADMQGLDDINRCFFDSNGRSRSTVRGGQNVRSRPKKRPELKFNP